MRKKKETYIKFISSLELKSMRPKRIESFPILQPCDCETVVHDIFKLLALSSSVPEGAGVTITLEELWCHNF